MSILGGADTIANLPYDAYTIKTMNLSRIARNQLLVLKTKAILIEVNNQQMAVIISDQ
jgi:hypothetical protein